MDQLAVRPGYPAVLDRTERLHVEVDRGGGVVDDEVWQDCGLNFDCHGDLLSRVVITTDRARDQNSSRRHETARVRQRRTTAAAQFARSMPSAVRLHDPSAPRSAPPAPWPPRAPRRAGGMTA